ncbi:MAG: hypothetical protein L0Y58_18155 [Verrucomicrobia subdivision 3 bacterium]|nr:hypothetical protein [Limisphaerales bacterium]
MRSHTYDFRPRDLIRLLATPVLPLVAFAALMHLTASLQLLPKPRATLDVDRTILVHQAEASRSRDNARVLLLGDSSCLIDVSATQLGEELRQPVLNLGTLSYLDLNANARLLREFNAANANQLIMVVLLMHPEALRRPAPEEYHTRFLESLLGEAPSTLHPFTPSASQSLYDSTIQRFNDLTIQKLLGLEIFRACILARTIPTPLSGAYGRRYGFSSDLEQSLTKNRGSAVDPDPRRFEGNAEYRLAPQLEAASRAFKAAVPSTAKLAVGITPVPEGFARQGYAEHQQAMLRQWAEWLQADVALSDLPATLPDHLFTKTTHLNEAGARTYTTHLARSLNRHLP